jgi:hypothetical protein
MGWLSGRASETFGGLFLQVPQEPLKLLVIPDELGGG